MRVWRLLVALCLWASLIAVVQPAVVEASHSFEEGWYEVSSVIDGDGLVAIGLAREVRFAGIQAPDWGQPRRDESKQFVQAAVFDLGEGWVYLKPAEIPVDPATGRYRAYVWIYVFSEGWWGFVQYGSVKFGLAKMDCSGQYASRWYYDDLREAERYAVKNGLYPSSGSPPFDRALC